MKTLLKLTSFLVILTIFFTSCSKDADKKGCTDPTAINYNNLAVEDDGSCEFLDSSFTVFANGELGYWGDITTGSFVAKSCFTNTTTIFLNPDTTITPPDTIITTNPPDTTIIPADTVITGDTYLLVNSDTTGKYALLVQMLNKKDASAFNDGYLVFNAKLHPDAAINDFELIIHGNHLSQGLNCDPYHYSDPVVISTSALDTANFTEISVPINTFSKRHLLNMDLVFGIKGTNAAPNTSLIMVRDIKWISRKEE